MQRSSAAEARELKEPVESLESHAINGSVTCRTTAVFPRALNENWEAFALKVGLPKNEVLVIALKEYLVKQGLQPDRRPRLEVSY